MANSGESVPAVIDSTYALEECLGEGGMGSVYRARHVHLNKAFALKLIHPRLLTAADSLRRFEVEAKALGRLTHPSIVRVTDYGVDPECGNTPYLVMEFLEGESLKDLLDREGALDPEDALEILEAVAEGLDFAHSQGILHRDLKPHNVILAYDRTGRRQVKIVDFGLARFVLGVAERVVAGAVHSGLFPELPSEIDHDSAHTMAIRSGGGAAAHAELREDDSGATVTSEDPLGASELPSGQTQAGTLVGTAGYMAPEVADREAATPASDIYSFGVLGYEMLVGKRPFKGNFMALLRAHVFDEPPTPSAVNPELAVELDEAILASMAKEPAARPATAGAAVASMRAAWDRLRMARWRARELPRRITASAAIALGAAVLVATVGGLGPIEDLENRLVDSRFLHSSPRPPSPDLVITMLDDDSLDADPDRPLIEYHEEFARVLRPAFEAGAAGVGLDFVGPKKWGRSEAFERFILEHADRVVLGIHSDPDDEKLVGYKFAEGFITVVLGEEAAARLFGYTNVILDSDGAVRRMKVVHPTMAGGWHPTLAARSASIITGSDLAAAEGEQAGDRVSWVDYRIEWRQIPRWTWAELPYAIEQQPEAFAGKFVLVGSDIEGFADSSFKMPHPDGMPEHAPGVVVQALMVNTLLDDTPIRGPVRWLPPLAAILMFPLAMATMWSTRVVPMLAGWLVFVVAFAALGYGLFIWTSTMVELAPSLIVFPLAIAGGVAIRWKLPSRPGTSGAGRSQ